MIFFAKRIGGGIATYRWGLGGGLQREFSGQYKNGENIVGLNDSTTQPIPEGSHDVYIWEDGELLAIVRFKVVGE